MPTGIYEVRTGDDTRLLAITREGIHDLQGSDVRRTAKRCNSASLPFAKVFHEWRGARRDDDSLTLVKVAERFARKKKKRSKPAKARLAPETLRASAVFLGSDAATTRAYLRALDSRSVPGKLAAALFRAQKASTRAKQYRGDSVDLAYDRKGDALSRLSELLTEGDAGLRWGWGEDSMQRIAPYVLYVDLHPQETGGQASFHSPTRFCGPDYPGEWDCASDSKLSVLLFCDQVMGLADSLDDVLEHYVAETLNHPLGRLR